MFNLPALKPNGSKVVPMSRRSPEDSLLSTETSSTLVMTVPSQLTSENAKAVQADTPMMQDLSVGDDISIARADYSSPLTPLVDDSGRKTREHFEILTDRPMSFPASPIASSPTDTDACRLEPASNTFPRTPLRRRRRSSIYPPDVRPIVPEPAAQDPIASTPKTPRRRGRSVAPPPMHIETRSRSRARSAGPIPVQDLIEYAKTNRDPDQPQDEAAAMGCNRWERPTSSRQISHPEPRRKRAKTPMAPHWEAFV
ncbi:hypothetical protein NliqN6_2882 [Naganishia liquefaciens]|uniref:Uncharacterized protein n=1 Tax=Naganishia liquefaciens TaxID=104408 RepID=A0A8H3TSM8_9TREE|nr:hypothetical protein NliqN6_2882 [Naganishia liquefaciens]